MLDAKNWKRIAYEMWLVGSVDGEAACVGSVDFVVRVHLFSPGNYRFF